MTVTDNARLVIERIERAFAGVRLEDGVSLQEADVIDCQGWLEPSDPLRLEARKNAETEDWRRIPESVIAHMYWALSFVDAKGMRFNLPAYMVFSVKHHRSSCSTSIDSAIYAMSREDARFADFSGPQRAAVRHFIKYMANNANFMSREEAHNVLALWNKPLTTASPKKGRHRG